MVQNEKTSKVSKAISEVLEVFEAFKKANKDQKVTFWEWVKIAMQGKDLKFVFEHRKSLKLEVEEMTTEEWEGVAHETNEKLKELELVGEKGFRKVKKSVALIVAADELWDEFESN